MNTSSLRPLIAFMLTAACLVAACAGTDSREVEPWSRQAAVHAYEYKELAIAWAQWGFSQTDCDAIAKRDPTGKYCELDQNERSGVFFLAGGNAPTVRTACQVPAEKTLFLPLYAYTLDNAGVPEEQWLSSEELVEIGKQLKRDISDFHLSVDGVPMTEFEAGSVEPTEFSYELPPEPNVYNCEQLSGVTGVVSPAFVTGYFAALPPPPPGEHEIEYGAVSFSGGRVYANSVTLQFTIE
jgi:hypothetical protein